MRLAGARRWKLLRLGVYCSIVGVLAAGLSLRSAYGGVKDAVLELGAELGKLGGAGSKQPILLNGEPIFVSSAVDDVPVGALLDRVEARCEKDPAGVTAELPGLPEEARAALREGSVARAAAGIVRHEDGDRGMIACFMRDASDAEPTLGAKLGAASRFLETGDLGHLGDLRYVFAERTAAERTHVVTAWTDGPFNLFNLFPAEGDAPGSDLAGVPRPEGSIRLLTAAIEGVPYSARIYEAPGAPEQLLRWYDAALESSGWERMIADGDRPRRVYARAGVHLFVLPQAANGRTMVTLVEMRAR